MGTKQFNNYDDLITFTRASKGHALRPVSYGDELVTNGTFDSDTSGWGSHSGAVLSAVNGRLRVAGQSGDSAYAAKQDLIVEVGKLYQIKADVFGPAATSFRIGSTERGTEYGNIIDSAVFINVVATTTLLSLTAYGLTADSYAEYDNISVKEVLFDQPDGTLTLFEHPTNIPRVEFDAQRNRLGLLVEEQRINLVTRSESFDNSAWTIVEGSITADTITAPDGTSTADFFVPSTNNAPNHLVRDSINVSSAQHSWSVFAKAGGYNWIRLIHDDGDDVSHSAYFDIYNGIVGAVSGSATASITDVGNGWYRCSVMASAAASASSTQNQFILVAEGDGNVTFAGDGTSGVYLWGAQIEEGSFPTSYIKNEGTSGGVTRSADVASIPVADFGYNQSAGTVLVEAKAINNNVGFPRVVNFQYDPSNRWELIGDTALDVRIFQRFNATTDVNSDIISNVLDGETSFKLAYAKAENDAAGSGNGGSVVTDTSNGQLNNVNTLYIGAGSNGSSDLLNGHIKSIKYYPRRLTNAQLQTLTEPRSDATLSLTFDGLESSFTENYIHG